MRAKKAPGADVVPGVVPDVVPDVVPGVVPSSQVRMWDLAWEVKYKELEAYKQKHGHMEVKKTVSLLSNMFQRDRQY